MTSELLSTAPPSRLRIAGFLALAIGALLAGLGALLTWANVGFPNDTGHVADVAVKGVDVWEGVVVLAIAAAALVALIVMRVGISATVRLAIAASLAAGGIVVVALSLQDIARAHDRFGGGGQLDRVARTLADLLGQPVDAIRALLVKNFGATLRVDVGAGLWMTLAGGVALVLAGWLSFLWARDRTRASAPSPDADASTTGESAPPA